MTQQYLDKLGILDNLQQTLLAKHQDIHTMFQQGECSRHCPAVTPREQLMQSMRTHASVGMLAHGHGMVLLMDLHVAVRRR